MEELRRCAPRAAAARRRPWPEPRGAAGPSTWPELRAPRAPSRASGLATNELNALESGFRRPGPRPRRREVSPFPPVGHSAYASMCSRIVICVPPAGACCCLMRTRARV